MAIHIYCTGCYTSNGLDAKSCSNCGATFGRDKKYRVCVSVKGKRVTRVIDNLTIARETEAAIKGDMVRGEYEIKQDKKTPTLGEVWSKYLPWAKEHKKSWFLFLPSILLMRVQMCGSDCLQFQDRRHALEYQ